MLRILHFVGIINGSDFIDTMISRLDPTRFEVSVLTGVPPRRPLEGAAYSTDVVGFPFTRRNYHRMLRALLARVRSFRPHVLHAHHYDESLVGSIARRLGVVPCYVIGHHYSDHIYVLNRGLKRRLFLAGETFSQNVANALVVPTDEVRSLLTERQEPPPCKVSVVPYGIDIEAIRPSSPDAPDKIRRELRLEENYVAMTCCRLNPEKGLQYLLQAVPGLVRRRPDFRLVLVGSGPFETELRDWCQRLDIESVVHFVGFRNDALDWLAAADVVIQPSLSESFCQTLVEALALEKPVVMTPVGAAPEVIGDNARGRLVPVADAQALEEALAELAGDPPLARRLARAGREHVLESLSPAGMARSYEEIYLDAYESSGGPPA